MTSLVLPFKGSYIVTQPYGPNNDPLSVEPAGGAGPQRRELPGPAGRPGHGRDRGRPPVDRRGGRWAMSLWRNPQGGGQG